MRLRNDLNMTMLVGILFDDLIIVAADCREVLIENGKIAKVIRDDINKIGFWNGGIIAGCGYVPLINNVKSSIENTEIEYNHELNQIVGKVIANSSIAENWLMTTHFLFTYFSSSGGRLFTISAKTPNDSLARTNQSAVILVPLESSSDLEKENKDLNTKLLSVSNFENEDQLVDYYIDLLTDLFKRVSEKSLSVSKNFNIIFHMPHKKTGFYISGNSVAQWD